MLEMVHYILRFIITMKHVIYRAILSAASGSGERCKLPSRVRGNALVQIKFDAFLPENPASGGTNFSFP